MFFRRKSILIALPVFIGTLILSIIFLGAQGSSDTPSFDRESTVKAQRDHQPLRDGGSVMFLSLVQHHGASASQEKSNSAGIPSGAHDRKASVDDQSGTARHVEMDPQHSHAAVNARSTTVEEASQAHRSGLYAVLLLLLESSRH